MKNKKALIALMIVAGGALVGYKTVAELDRNDIIDIGLVERLETPEIRVENNLLKWESSEGVKYYEILIDGEKFIHDMSSTEKNYLLDNLEPGEHKIQVRAMSDKYKDSKWSDVLTHKVLSDEETEKYSALIKDKLADIIFTKTQDVLDTEILAISKNGDKLNGLAMLQGHASKSFAEFEVLINDYDNLIDLYNKIDSDNVVVSNKLRYGIDITGITKNPLNRLQEYENMNYDAEILNYIVTYEGQISGTNNVLGGAYILVRAEEKLSKQVVYDYYKVPIIVKDVNFSYKEEILKGNFELLGQNYESYSRFEENVVVRTQEEINAHYEELFKNKIVSVLKDKTQVGNVELIVLEGWEYSNKYVGIVKLENYVQTATKASSVLKFEVHLDPENSPKENYEKLSKDLVVFPQQTGIWALSNYKDTLIANNIEIKELEEFKIFHPDPSAKIEIEDFYVSYDGYNSKYGAVSGKGVILIKLTYPYLVEGTLNTYYHTDYMLISKDIYVKDIFDHASDFYNYVSLGKFEFGDTLSNETFNYDERKIEPWGPTLENQQQNSENLNNDNSLEK